MGHQLLDSQGSHCFKDMIGQKGENSLFDISSWDRALGLLRGSDFGAPPSHLFHLVASMEQKLHGCALKNLEESDCSGWGLAEYPVKQSYAQQLSRCSLPHKA